MSALLTLPATGTIAGLDLELSDDRDNRRQIGLILNDRVAFDEFRGQGQRTLNLIGGKDFR